jgi:hypothetical protein
MYVYIGAYVPGASLSFELLIISGTVDAGPATDYTELMSCTYALTASP